MQKECDLSRSHCQMLQVHRLVSGCAASLVIINVCLITSMIRQMCFALTLLVGLTKVHVL